MTDTRQQLLGLVRPATRASKWRGPRETAEMRSYRLWKERKAHEKRKARIWANVQLPKLKRMP